ncbi:MAG: tetratricopeptide repeat protein [Pseudomonadota bacterium]
MALSERVGNDALEKGDYATAFKWFRNAAEQGHAAAQYNLGNMYHSGKGVPQNDPETAEQGDAQAQYNLGLIYAKGVGVYPNLQEAIKWARKAAEQGHANAQNLLKQLSAL